MTRLEPGNWYFDGSPPGTGKTHAGIELTAGRASSLTVAPSHDQGAEIVKRLRKVGVWDVAKFPRLSTEAVGDEPATCGNPELLEQALMFGLPPSSTVCLECEQKDSCIYQIEMKKAEKAKHQVATHSRAENSLRTLAEEKELVLIQEDAINAMASKIHVDTPQFDRVAELMLACYHDTTTFETELAWFFDRAHSNAMAILEQIATGEGPVSLGSEVPAPPNLFKRIYQNVKVMESPPNPESLRCVLAMTAGELRSLNVHTTENTEGRSRLVVTAVRRNQVPENTTVLFGDATATPEHFQIIAGSKAIIDITPRGEILPQHPIRQVPLDVLQTSKPQRVLAILRAAMLLLPSAKRIGVITHQCHRRLIGRLDDCLRTRIVRVSHFWSTDSRGSDTWPDTCDAIIVLGTPRAGVGRTKARMIQLGLGNAMHHPGRWTGRSKRNEPGTESSRREYGWYWSGLTESGQVRVIRTNSYCDHRWRMAFASETRAELIQAVGRARSLNDEGIPCVVVSTEKVPRATLVDRDPPLIGDLEWQWLAALRSGPKSTRELVEVGGDSRSVQRFIAALLGAGLAVTRFRRHSLSNAVIRDTSSKGGDR